MGDVIPSRIGCTKGWEEVHWGKLMEWEHPGKEKGVNSARDLGMLQHGGKRLQLHWIIEWENG